jgi:guanosine-3',5'-bis(diphosphate) 3'-pyrophosphohydrolase
MTADSPHPLPELGDFPGLLLKTILFAAQKHREQRRKDIHQSAYINHPIQVAELLWRLGGVRNPDVIQAALLHDTLEDTDATMDELTREFGQVIAKIVLEVTDDKSKPKAVRKQLQIDHAPFLSSEAKLVKLADKICNVRDVVEDPPADWPESRRKDYLDWAKAVVDGLHGVHPGLEQEFDRVLKVGKQQFAKHSTHRLK